jgi:MFS family permease
VYINEMVPPHIRGVVMTFWQMFYSVGAFIAYWVRFGCSRHEGTLGEWDWRMVIVFQLLMPILIVSQVYFLPDTPRWYIQKGDRVEAARAALRRVRDTEDEAEGELLSIREALAYERQSANSGYSALWRDASVRKRLLLAFALNIGQQLTGQGTLNTYSTIIYKRVFDGQTVDLINALNATFGIIFTLNAMWTADRYGRKFLFIVGAVGMGVCMLMVAAIGTETPFYDAKTGLRTWDKLNGTKTHGVAVAISCMLFLFTFFCAPPIPPISELTPARQAVVGRDDVDLDVRGLLDERAGAGDGHGVADAEHRQQRRAAVLPRAAQQRGLLLLLHVHGRQHAAGRLRVVLRPGDQGRAARGDGRALRRREPRRRRRGADRHGQGRRRGGAHGPGVRGAGRGSAPGRCAAEGHGGGRGSAGSGAGRGSAESVRFGGSRVRRAVAFET